MPRCPFATWMPITGSAGSYLSGPFKIVHHTTEGSTATGAFSAFRTNGSDPHFTVDNTTIYQHVDTSVSARALRNADGGVQTNRDSAIQIELVGFANRPKTRPSLINLARLCRWLEAQHNIPKVWPNGFPKVAVNGRDPGGHNRNALKWDTEGGHFGHCHVPENTHWDPAYTADEVNFIMNYQDGMQLETVAGHSSIPETDPGLADAVSEMPDHAHGVLTKKANTKAKTKPKGAAKKATIPKKKKKKSRAASRTKKNKIVPPRKKSKRMKSKKKARR